MYAIVEIAGKQFRVAENMKLKVPFQQTEPGKQVQFEKVLLVTDDKGGVKIGTPAIKNILVSATVVEHGREKKIIVFKKKRRKGYQKKNGHRQDFSLISIDKIGAASAPAKTEKETVDKTEKIAAAPKKAKTKAAAEKPAVKKKSAPKKKATTKKDVKED